jgi:endonuclease/exonuclease/phosphatase family metal-dependent hydrolase
VIELRVGTWNVREGVSADDGRSFDPAAVVGDLDLDLLIMQEVPIIPGNHRGLAKLASRASMRYLRTLPLYGASFTGAEAGLASLSRFRITGSHRTYFDPPGLFISVDDGGRVEPVQRKGMLRITVDLPELKGSLNVLNLHQFPFSRLKAAPTAAKFGHLWDTVRSVFADTSATGPTVLAGDFNTSNRSLALPSPAYRRAIGDRPTHEGFAADDILTSPGLSVLATETLSNPSDHLLCVATLGLRAQA